VLDVKPKPENLDEAKTKYTSSVHGCLDQSLDALLAKLEK